MIAIKKKMHMKWGKRELFPLVGYRESRNPRLKLEPTRQAAT